MSDLFKSYIKVKTGFGVPKFNLGKVLAESEKQNAQHRAKLAEQSAQTHAIRLKGAAPSKAQLRKAEREREEAERKWKNSKQGRKEEAARVAAAEAEQLRQREETARVAAEAERQRRAEAARVEAARAEAARAAAAAEERRLAARTPAEVEADRRAAVAQAEKNRREALAKAEQDRREAAARAERERREAIAREEAIQRRNVEREKTQSTFIGHILDLGVDEFPNSFAKRILYRSLAGSAIIAAMPFAVVPTWYNEIGNILLEKKPFKTKIRAKIARAAIKMAKPFVVAGSLFGVVNGAFFQHNPIEAGANAKTAVDKSVSAVGNLFAEKEQVTSLGGKIAEKVISVPIGVASFTGAFAGNIVGTAVDFVVFKPVGWAFGKAADSMFGDSSPPPTTTSTTPQPPQPSVKISYSVKNISQSLG